jgi:hypothetical protein
MPVFAKTCVCDGGKQKSRIIFIKSSYSSSNRVLRRVFGPKRDEATGEWRKLHNEELNNLYSSSSIVWVVKSRRMK